ncbi:pogo transposable element with KRAB domain-like protein, partial [Leptotrombidium deliense]
MDALLVYSSSSEDDNDSLLESSILLRRHEYDMSDDENENILNLPDAEVVCLNEEDDDDVQIMEPAVIVLQSTENINFESSQSTQESSYDSPGSSNHDSDQRSQENREEQRGSIQKIRQSYTIGTKLQKEGEVAIRRRRVVRSDKNSSKPMLPETEKKLFQWFNEQRDKGLGIHRREIRFQAIKINNELQERPAFSASNGWIDRFLNRHGLCMRTATSVGQKVPINAKELAMNFLQYIKNYNEKHSNCDIIYANMDEVPVWFDMPGNRTYNKKGARIVPLKTTGNEKLRFTVILAAMSDGRKCKPMIIFKGLKNVPRCSFPADVVISVAEKGSTNKEKMNEWNRKVWKYRPSA